MSDPAANDPTGQPGAPDEEALRAAYEAELDRIDAIDMIAQAAVSLLNIGARRLGPPPGPAGEQPAGAAPGRDLEQARDAIDGAAALLAILERRLPTETRPLKDALARLQMAYAAEAGAAGRGAPAPGTAAAGPGPGPGGSGPGAEPPPGPEPPPGSEPGAQQAPEQGSEPPGPGPAESSGRLWVPGR
ncbi:MAG: hypothetical protein ACYDC2_06470 [Solirubrobacteraceae bacterium]